MKIAHHGALTGAGSGGPSNSFAGIDDNAATVHRAPQRSAGEWLRACSGLRGFANLTSTPRTLRATTRDPEPSYPAWKADAVKAIQKLHWSAAAVTRNGLWTNLYVRGFSPEEAAKLAERECHSTRPPDWLKRRR